MVDTSVLQTFVILGLLFIILGIAFLALPFLVRLMPSVERLPPILFWVYRRGDFYFGTSPILLIISLILILAYLLRARQ